ncbi:unnamed protein product [Rotaria sp. Silwood2]|nr:unnamed protein product [Rotaria sp. Silwood2]
MLRSNRWIVVLGDPGSGKTTFVRWLVSKSIGKVRGHMPTMCNDRITSVGDDDKDKNAHGSDESFLDRPIRIPILIRVGEFAEALSSNSDLSF